MLVLGLGTDGILVYAENSFDAAAGALLRNQRC